jgi:NADH-quinone oxidoreductase subunit J
MVIMVQNSVYSILFLVLSFVSSASLLCLLEYEFMTLIFILIYVGAIAVLFLFVVMMLDIKTANLAKDSIKYLPFASFVAFIFVTEILLVISNNFKSNPYLGSFLSNNYINWLDKTDFFTELESLGQIIYTSYILQFLIAGLILLLAVVGAVVLTLTPNSQTFQLKKGKKQNIFKQLSRTFKNSILYSTNSQNKI